MLICIVQRVGRERAQLRIRRSFFLADLEELPRGVKPGDEVEMEISPVRRVEGEEAEES